MGAKKKKWLFSLLGLGLLLVLLVYCAPSMAGGYSYTDKGAIGSFSLYKGGTALLERSFGNRKIVIWDSGNARSAILITKVGGVLHRVRSLAEFNPSDANVKMKMTWSASLTSDQRYDTILAAEIMDPSIKKVVVTNEGRSKELSSVEEARMQSSIYVEMDVVHGYAVQLESLSPAEAGNFVFRGLDDRGNIVSTN